MKIYLQEIATVLPESKFSTEALLGSLDSRISKDLRKSILGMGIENRFSVIKNYDHYFAGKEQAVISSTTTKLGARALHACVEKLRDSNDSEVGLLIAVTNTQSSVLPGLAPALVAESLQIISPWLSTINMQGQGCSGLMKAAEVASWYLASNPHKLVAIVVSEAQTPYIRPLTEKNYFGFSEIKSMNLDSQKNQLLSNSATLLSQGFLFGDGALALVLGTKEQNICFGPVCNLTNFAPEDADLLRMDEGGSIKPFILDSEKARYSMGPRVPVAGADYAKKVAMKLLSMPGVEKSLSHYEAILIHTGSKKILDGVCETLGILPSSPKVQNSYAVLRNHGNLSSASIGFMLAQEDFKDGPIFSVSFGVGFSAAASTLTALRLARPQFLKAA